MANMATLREVNECWTRLGEIIDVNDVLPVTYVNSSAEVKAFCGRHNGVVCTSGNARRVLEWALAQKSRVLFMPDQHLGRNTAIQMGIPSDEIVMRQKSGGTPAFGRQNARILLWGGLYVAHR